MQLAGWWAEATPAGQRQGKTGNEKQLDSGNPAHRHSRSQPAQQPLAPTGSFTRSPTYVGGVPTQLKTQLARTEAILEDEQLQRQKLVAEFEEVRLRPGGPEPSAVSGCWGVWPREADMGLEGPSGGGVAMHSVTCLLSRLELLSHHAGCPPTPSGLLGL